MQKYSSTGAHGRHDGQFIMTAVLIVYMFSSVFGRCRSIGEEQHIPVHRPGALAAGRCFCA